MSDVHCQSCGAANEAGSNFCLDCGRRISDSPELSDEMWAETQSRKLVQTEVIAIPVAETKQADVSGQDTQHSEAVQTIAAHLKLTEGTEAGRNNAEPAAEETAGTRAARELARVAGMSAQTRISPSLRGMIAGLALLLTFGAWLIYRDQGNASATAGRNRLNLIDAEELSRRMLQLGQRYREEGNFAKAIDQFREALNLTPNNTEARFLMARTCYSDGRVEDAIRHYHRLLETDDKNIEARLNLADIYRTRGQWGEAEREYRRIINLKSESEQAQTALDWLEKMAVERRAAYPLPTDVRRPAREHRVAGRELPPAADLSNVEVPVSEMARGVVPSVPLNASEPENPVEEERTRRSFANVYKTRGNRLSSARRYADAIREYQNAQKLTPEDPDLHYLIGTAFFRSGQYAVAVEHYRKCNSGTYAAVARNAVRNADEQLHKTARKQKKQ